MDFVIHCRGDERIYPLPSGLYELMSDITREVLRSQPQNLYNFIYNYLEAQIKTRELTHEAIDIMNKVIIDGQPMLKYLSERGLTLEQANAAARKIQNYWRRIVKFRMEGRECAGSEPCHKGEEAKEEPEMKPGSKQQYLLAEQFIVKIQAAFRGYLARKKLFKELHEVDDESLASWDHDWLWREFEDLEGMEKLTQEERVKNQKLFLKYLPRRRVAVNRIRLNRIVRGFEDDYDQPAVGYEGFRLLDRSKVLRRPTMPPEYDLEEKAEMELSPPTSVKDYDAGDVEGLGEEDEMGVGEYEYMMDEEYDETEQYEDQTEDEEDSQKIKSSTSVDKDEAPLENKTDETNVQDAGVTPAEPAQSTEEGKGEEVKKGDSDSTDVGEATTDSDYTDVP